MVSRPAIVCLLGLALAAGGCDRSTGGNGQADAAQGQDAISDEVTADEVPAGAAAPVAPVGGKVDRSHAGTSAPAVSLRTPDGRTATLATYRGKPVLVNLWATWCAPCVKEMPTLDTAATTLGERVPVVAISQDLDPNKATAFLAARRFTALQPMLDPELGFSLALGVNLPTTILYDAAGKEVWRVTGERDWASAESRALITDS